MHDNQRHDLSLHVQATAHPSGAASLIQPSGTKQPVVEAGEEEVVGVGMGVAAGMVVVAGGEDGHPQSAPVPDGV